MKLSQINSEYLLEMVLSMYRYEASLVWEPELLTDKEIFDFYSSYMGYPSCRVV